MACKYRDSCSFFDVDIGYSPELNRAMRQRFCGEDNSGCARLIAFATIGEDIPADLLPSDTDRLADLGVPASRVVADPDS